MKRTAEVIRKEGNELFQQHFYSEAISKYSQALKVIDKDRILTSLLNNTAVAMSSSSIPTSEDPLQNSKRMSHAVVYASGAYTIDPSFMKASIYRDQGLILCNSKHQLHNESRDTESINVAIDVSVCLDNSFEDIISQRKVILFSWVSPRV